MTGLAGWLATGLAGRLVGWLSVGLATGLMVGLVTGLAAPLSAAPPTDPRYPVRDDLVVGLVGGVGVALATGVVGGVVGGLRAGFAVGFAGELGAGFAGGLMVGLGAGFAIGLAGGLYWLTGVGRRYLVFLCCARTRLPWHLGAFLQWAYEAGILRISGVAYQFRHRELQDWLTAHPTL
ncbi:hypothetical protein [Streptomyces sp. NBC_00328]|uniref:hypothetical protein n=1 Tax=Streptomyces sp. NBC_00328 TaxID=2903646 RepID=UPI002E2CE253|nr:hypothetical protein [Streptomyces sp. NBC_00328]